MSLTWHLLKTDLRHTRWSLLAWSIAQLLFAANLLAYWHAPEWFMADRTTSRPLLANGIVTFAVILVAFDFGVRLIQSDNPALPHAFWRTRPIHPLRLLTAKLCTFLVAIALSALPALALLASAFRDLPLNLLGSQYQFHLWVQAIPVLGAITFGSLTTSSRQCLLATILTFVGAGVVVALRSAQFTDNGAALEAARMMAMAMILGLTALVAVLHQFLSNRRTRSLVIASLGLATVLSIPWWWSWSLDPKFPSVAREMESPFTHSVIVKTARQIDNAYTSSRSGISSFHYEVLLENLPANHALSVTAALHRWPKSGTSTPAAPGNSIRSIEPKNVAAFLTARDFPTNSVARYQVSQNKEHWGELLRTDSPQHFSADLTFTLAAPDIIYTLPLNTRETVRNGAGRAKIAAVNPENGTVWVSAIAFTKLPPKTDSPPLPFPDAVGYLENNYTLRHTKTGEQFSVSREQSTSTGLFSIWKFRISPPDKSPLPTNDWLDHAELLVIATRPVAQFTRAYTTPEPGPR